MFFLSCSNNTRIGSTCKFFVLLELRFTDSHTYFIANLLLSLHIYQRTYPHHNKHTFLHSQTVNPNLRMEQTRRHSMTNQIYPLNHKMGLDCIEKAIKNDELCVHCMERVIKKETKAIPIRKIAELKEALRACTHGCEIVKVAEIFRKLAWINAGSSPTDPVGPRAKLGICEDELNWVDPRFGMAVKFLRTG